MRLLLIEDNGRLATLTAAGLTAAGFSVDVAGGVEEAAAAFAAVSYDVAVLDLGLPDGDGMDLLNDLRRRGDATPVLILTARDGVGDRVNGLNRGADDYLVKPFATEELVARLRVLLRRPGHLLGLTLTQGNISFDTVNRQATVNGAPLELGRRELDALEILLRRAGRVVAKGAIETAVYNFNEEIGSNAVEVLIHRLRKRLQAAGASAAVHTLRGVGYLLGDDET